MFGINKTLKSILTKLSELQQQLTLTRGSVYQTEGIAGRILNFVKNISEKVDKIFDLLNSEIEEDQSAFFFSKFKIGNIIVEGRLEKITMNEFEFVEATLEGVKKNNSPATWHGEPTIETDRPDAVIAEVIDNKTVRLTGIHDVVTEPTAINVTVKVDADLGEGVEEQTATGILVMEPGRLTGLKLTFGEPQPQPDANPPVE